MLSNRLGLGILVGSLGYLTDQSFPLEIGRRLWIALIAMPYLNALSGTAFGKRYELKNAETILGRHPECDVVLDAGAVSRQHAKVVLSMASSC